MQREEQIESGCASSNLTLLSAGAFSRECSIPRCDFAPAGFNVSFESYDPYR